MKVELKYKTKDTPEGKIMNINNKFTVKTARAYYKRFIEMKATEAYLTYFDGWHDKVYKILKKKGQ